MGDFGSQKHVFSSTQAWIIPKIDALFGVTEEEIRKYVEPPEEKTQQWLRLRKVGDESGAGGGGAKTA